LRGFVEARNRLRKLKRLRGVNINNVPDYLYHLLAVSTIRAWIGTVELVWVEFIPRGPRSKVEINKELVIDLTNYTPLMKALDKTMHGIDSWIYLLK
jgi:hypothetical protein